MQAARNQCRLLGKLQWQIAAGGPSHFVGPFFSGANAAFGYLPLQLALRFEGRKLKDPSGERPILRTMKGEHAFRPGEGPFYGQIRGKAHFVRRMAVFPDYNGPRIAGFKCF